MEIFIFFSFLFWWNQAVLRRANNAGKDRRWPRLRAGWKAGARPSGRAVRDSGAFACETARFQAATFAERAEQQQSRAQHRQADDAQSEKVRMVTAERVGVRRPGFMGLGDGQHSEPAWEPE